jgi:hypothetical protein
MLTRISYIALGFLVGVGCFIVVMTSTNDATNLAKTGRITPAAAPTNFVMERFAG